MATIKVGISDQDAFTLPGLRARRRLLGRVAAAGLDHITVGRAAAVHPGAGRPPLRADEGTDPD